MDSTTPAVPAASVPRLRTLTSGTVHAAYAGEPLCPSASAGGYEATDQEISCRHCLRMLTSPAYQALLAVEAAKATPDVCPPWCIVDHEGEELPLEHWSDDTPEITLSAMAYKAIPGEPLPITWAALTRVGDGPAEIVLAATTPHPSSRLSLAEATQLSNDLHLLKTLGSKGVTYEENERDMVCEAFVLGIGSMTSVAKEVGLVRLDEIEHDWAKQVFTPADRAYLGDILAMGLAHIRRTRQLAQMMARSVPIPQPPEGDEVEQPDEVEPFDPAGEPCGEPDCYICRCVAVSA